MKPQRHSKLAHLPDDQYERLVERYYAGAKSADLLSEFRIEARASDLFKLFSPKPLAQSCPYCQVNLWQKLQSKSSRTSNSPYCPSCAHEHMQGTYRKCRCANCLRHVAEVDAAIQETTRALIQGAHPAAEIWESPDLDNLTAQLTLRDVVYLTALYQNSSEHGSGTFGPPFAKERPLAPTDEMMRQMLDHLCSRGLIRVSDTSPLDSFQFNDELTQTTAYYIFKVRYRLFPMLPVAKIGDAFRVLDQMANKGYWLFVPENAADRALELWKELALHESLEAFLHQGQLHNFEPPSGEKTVLTFEALLGDFSVAQVYNIVWNAARNAAAYYQRGGVSKPQAANSMVGYCRTRGDKSKVEGWEIKPYNRNFDRPRSELSHALHDVFLKIGDQGFTHKPSRDLLCQVSTKSE